MTLDTNLKAILFVGAVVAAIALSGIAEGQNIGASGIYDVQTHKAYAVLVAPIKPIAVQGKFSLNLDGFAGTSTGAGSTLIGGSSLCVSYAFTAIGKPFTFNLGPSFEVIGDRKPGWGFVFGIKARF